MNISFHQKVSCYNMGKPRYRYFITCLFAVLITPHRNVPLSLGYLLHNKEQLFYCYTMIMLHHQLHVDVMFHHHL